MATFTRNWQESSPDDNSNANEIDTFILNLRGDCSDRLKDMAYGFTAGENDGVQGFKKVTMKQQAAAPGTPAADIIELYCIDDGSNAGLYAKQEDGYVKQILKKSGTSLLLNVDSADTTGKALGAITVSGLTASANLDIGAYELRAQTLEADVATGTAPLTIASTTKVTNLNADKVDGYDVSAYSGGESYTFPGGLIIKSGYLARTAQSTTLTFGSAFPNAIVSIVVTVEYGSTSNIIATVSGISTSGCTIVTNTALGDYRWIAIGY